MNTRPILMGGLALAIAIGSFAAACGDDDSSGGGSSSGKDVEALKADIAKELAAEKAGDADTYLAHHTDSWLKNIDGTTREEIKADPGQIQSDEPPTILSYKVSGSKGTVTFTQGGRLDYVGRVSVVKEGGVWKLDGLHVQSAEKIPASAKKVNVDLTDFAFGFTRKDVTSKTELVFHIENKGKQPHMVVMNKIPEKADLDKILQSHDDDPSVENVGGVYLFAPGDKADVVIKGKLAPGRYVMLCFVDDKDDKEHTPHFVKGMKADFMVE